MAFAPKPFAPFRSIIQLNLDDEEAAALLKELNNIIENYRYPLSPRICVLRGIREIPYCSTDATVSPATDARAA
jgi:hypothetical protein